MRQTQGLLVLTLALVFLFATAPAGVSVPTGPGGPECGLAVLPCSLEPGENQGTLSPVANERDHYTFTPPTHPSVIRIDARSDATVQVLLWGPEGKLRGHGSNIFDPDIHAHAVAQPTGQWRLEIGYYFGQGALLGNAYQINLAYESFDHVERLTAPGGKARTFSADFPDGENTFLEAVYSSPGGENANIDSYVFSQMLFVNTTEIRGGFASIGLSCCGLSGQVKTWGAPLDDLDVALPGLPGQPLSLGSLGIDSHGFPMRLTYGLAFSMGLDNVDLWLAYNGDTPPDVEFPQGDTMFTRSLSEFEGDGPGVHAAGYTQAQNLWTEHHMPGEQTALSILMVNGRSPGFHLQPSKVFVERPDGERLDMSGQWDAFFWDQVLEGTWRVEVEHVDGLEMDNIRFAGVSFPLDEDWLFGPR